MAAVVKRLAVFAYLDDDWAPAGLLEMTEEGVSLQASSFAYGLRYLGRPNAIEVDPVSLSLARKDEIRGKMNFPAGGLTQFGGIRDAAPDAWGRRVIEAKLRAKANALPESTYLLHAGSQRIGALDVRESLDTPPARRRAMACSTSNTWSIRRRASRKARPCPPNSRPSSYKGAASAVLARRRRCEMKTACCGWPNSRVSAIG